MLRSDSDFLVSKSLHNNEQSKSSAESQATELMTPAEMLVESHMRILPHAYLYLRGNIRASSARHASSSLW